MFYSSPCRSAFSVGLALFLSISTTSSFAAEIPGPTVAGSVYAYGKVEVRDVSLSREGTLFFGDTVRTGPDSRGKLTIANGNKIELFSNTQCVVGKSNRDARVGLTVGNLGFAASNSPVVVTVGDYEVLPEAGATGGVATLSKDYAGVRVMTGNVVIHNLTSNKSIRISAGEVRIIGLKDHDMNVPLAQLASVDPTSLPSAAPMPRQRGQRLTPRQWGLIAAAIGAGAGTAIYFATKCDSSASPSC